MEHPGSDVAPPPVNAPPPATVSEVIVPLDPSRLAISLPPGFQFRPTDEQLLFHYLKGKVTTSEIPDAIAEIDLEKHEPWDLRGLSRLKSDTEWYFFCKKHVWISKSRMRTPKGVWIPRPRTNQFSEKNSGDFQGAKTTFDYHLTKDLKETLMGWTMEEYFFANRFDHFSLCKVSKTKIETSPGPAMTEQAATSQVTVEEQVHGDESSSSSDDDAATALLLIPQPQTE